MEIEQKKQEFQAHHKNTFNILFHIGCGLVYMSLFLSLLPSEFFWVYGGIVILFFPNVQVFLGLVALFFGASWLRNQRLGLGKTFGLILFFYVLPEVSHWLTQEETVLQANTISLLDIVDNFFFLYPHSLLSLS
jgi:hypothetical protein